MNTEALEYFIKVYEKKSVTAAAKDLYITPQGISKTIRQLEMELETELFYRGPRGMEATKAGELLHARAKHIHYLIEDIQKEIRIMNGRKGTLNVVITYSISSVLPVDFLYRFSAHYPEIQIKLKEFPDEYPLTKIFQEEADVGLVIGIEEMDDCEFEMLVSGEVVVVVAKSHPLAGKDEISVKELANEALVVKAAGSGKENGFVEKCLEQGFTPNVIHEFGNIISAHRLCERNGAVAVSIDFVEDSLNNDNLKRIRLMEKIPQDIYLVFRKRGIQSKAIALFQSYVADKCKSF